MDSSDEIQLLLVASGVGLATGAAVVALNVAVHEIRDVLFASMKAGDLVWQPVLGGLAVSLAFFLVGGPAETEGTALPVLRAVAKGKDGGRALAVDERARRALLRSGLAAATLGSGNSLGPEGPSVEIGANVAAFLGGFGNARAAFLDRADVKLGLLASGCAAGVAAGFNAPIAGLFFAMEVVRPSRKEETESIVSRLLAAAFAATVVQIGLGSSPAVKGINFSDITGLPYRELPLYMLLGALCGTTSSSFVSAKKLAGRAFEKLAERGVPPTLHPIVGSLAVVIIVSIFGLPELLYTGFDTENTILIQAGSIAPERLLAVVFWKLFLTAVCISCGLVGGVFAPSLLIGGALGALYGQGAGAFAHMVGSDISPATDYAAVGAAAALAGICGVPLTAVVLLLELTAGTDYAICLPLISAVGLSVYVEKALSRGPSSFALSNVSEDALERVAMLSGEEQRAVQVFRMLDKNKDGTLSQEEFSAWYVQRSDGTKPK